MIVVVTMMKEMGNQKQKERNYQLGNFQSLLRKNLGVHHPTLYGHNHPDYNDRTAITMVKKKMGKQFGMSGVLILNTCHTIIFINLNINIHFFEKYLLEQKIACG